MVVGTSGWSYDHWRGVFCPEGLAKAKWFEFLADRFGTVELNASPESTVRRELHG